MTVIYSYIPGQISLGPSAPLSALSAVLDSGQHTKIDSYQINTAMVANHTHMPFPYLPDSPAHADTIFGELDRKAWLKGILVGYEWGDIETADGVYDWTLLDAILDTVRGLPKATGKNKKVLFLTSTRSPGSLNATGLIPAYLLTQNMAVNGGYYKNTTTYPPSQTNPIVNAKKYDNLWCYEAANPNQPGGPVEPRGYEFNLYKLTDAAGTNTFKTKFQAFLAAIAARYNNDDVFAGVITTESATGSPFVAYEAGNSRNSHYEGRKNFLKYMKTVFTTRFVAEACNFDKAHYQDMTDPGATDGLIANRLAYTNPNIHTGTNMNLGNILPVLSGKTVIVMQTQGLDMRTLSGNRPKYYNWPTDPTQILSGDGIHYNDPPTPQWLFDRARYFKANLYIVQRNLDTQTHPDQMNWQKWKAFMDAGAYANDPLGGMDGTRPQIIV